MHCHGCRSQCWPPPWKQLASNYSSHTFYLNLGHLWRSHLQSSLQDWLKPLGQIHHSSTSPSAQSLLTPSQALFLIALQYTLCMLISVFSISTNISKGTWFQAVDAKWSKEADFKDEIFVAKSLTSWLTVKIPLLTVNGVWYLPTYCGNIFWLLIVA